MRAALSLKKSNHSDLIKIRTEKKRQLGLESMNENQSILSLIKELIYYIIQQKYRDGRHEFGV